MSQIILDDQLSRRRVEWQLASWIKADLLRDVRPGEIIKDERVPTVLRALHRPTFVTIDTRFWNRRLRDAKYSIIYFAFEDAQ